MIVNTFPHSSLRLPARAVKEWKTIPPLVAKMSKTLLIEDGIGLAANQVGSLQRLFLLHLEGKIIAFVNPKITNLTLETAIAEEGCLSFPGLSVPVKRSLKVMISAADEKGEEFELILEGWEARAAQHELDHLDGVLIIDRATINIKDRLRAYLFNAGLNLPSPSLKTA